jgi:tetratricopeptide (TPR) repeat protein
MVKTVALVICLGAAISQPGIARSQSVLAGARSLERRADSLRHGSEGDRLLAIELYRKAADTYRDGRQRRSRARVLHRIADTFENVGRLDSALIYYSRVRPLFHAAADDRGSAHTLSSTCGIQLRLARPDSALTSCRLAQRFWRAIGDRQNEGATLLRLGYVHKTLGSTDSALIYTRGALQLFRSVDINSSTSMREVEIETLLELGSRFADLGLRDSALATFAEARSVSRVSGLQGSEADVLSRLASLYQRSGWLDSATTYNVEALEIFSERGDTAQVVTTLQNIAAQHQALGRDSLALAYEERALALARQAGFSFGVARGLISLGSLHRNLGRFERALAYYMQGLEIQRAEGYRQPETITLTEIAGLYQNLGRVDSAFAFYAAAESAMGATKDENAAIVSLGLARLHAARGHRDSALFHLTRARSQALDAHSLAAEAATFREIGRFHLMASADGSAPALAAQYFDSAAAALAKLRRRAGSDATTLSYAETKADTYSLWMRAWLAIAGREFPSARADGHVAAALAAAERGRAQALRDLIDQSAQREGEFAEGLADSIPGADLVSEGIRALTALRGSRTTALYYHFADDTLHTWLLTPGGELRLLPRRALPQDSLNALILELRSAFGAEDARGQMARNSAGTADPEVTRGGTVSRRARADAVSSALSDALIPAGLTGLVPPGSEIVVIPHGVLGVVPFASLPLADDTVALGVRYALRFAPSLRALNEAEARSPDSAAAWAASSQALVVGNPLMPSVTDESGRRSALVPLPNAGEEARWIAHKLRAAVLTGAGATESAVRAGLPRAWLIHLATHGMAFGSEARVARSFVALAPDATNDGLLTLGELLSDAPNLSADLVVLSACQTGLGNLRQAEGTVGFQRTLLAKGARSVLVSLWSVSDEATRILMERFYTHWLDDPDRPSKAEALRRAQRDVRETAGLEHPRFWAAFQLVGAR